jgi:TrmH family RNA methyltransferase
MTKNEIHLIRSLDDKRSREEAGLFVAEGAKLVGDLAASGFAIRKIFRVGDDTSPKDMSRASHLKTPSDTLALVELPRREFAPTALAGQLTLALDGVQNPGNLGTIIRLADWFGIRNVLASSDSADCFNPKVVQATMGALARVAVHYGSIPELLGGTEMPVYGTFLEGENIYTTPLTSPGVIVLGSEGRGISPPVARMVTRKLFIPPYPQDVPTSESLNVAVAAAIVCSEFRRPV